MGQMVLTAVNNAHVQRLFQSSPDNGVVPELWKRSTIAAMPNNNLKRI